MYRFPLPREQTSPQHCWAQGTGRVGSYPTGEITHKMSRKGLRRWIARSIEACHTSTQSEFNPSACVKDGERETQGFLRLAGQVVQQNDELQVQSKPILKNNDWERLAIINQNLASTPTQNVRKELDFRREKHSVLPASLQSFCFAPGPCCSRSQGTRA